MDELGRQLRCPAGEDARQVGDMMYASNANMITQTIDALHITGKSDVLEIGFGNGRHLPYLLARATGINYRGVDISAAMMAEATAHNPVENVQFFLIDGSGKLNFPDVAFDACFTVNTLYFWPDVPLQLAEIRRILRPSGQFSMGFIEPEFGSQLPFAQTGFIFYAKEELSAHLRHAGFSAIQYRDFTEQVKSKDGREIMRPFTVLTAS